MESWLLKSALSWSIDRLQEPSTWAGFALALSHDWHIQFSGDFTKTFINLGVAAAALAAVALKEGVTK